MKEKEIKITLDFLPPSVNEVYSGYRKRHKSQVYKDFMRDLEIFFMNHDKKYTIKDNEWLSIDYKFYFPLYFKNGNIRKKDVGNLEKTLTDGLSHFIDGFLDEKIKDIKLTKIDSDEVKTEIIIKEVKENDNDIELENHLQKVMDEVKKSRPTEIVLPKGFFDKLTDKKICEFLNDIEENNIQPIVSNKDYKKYMSRIEKIKKEYLKEKIKEYNDLEQKILFVGVDGLTKEEKSKVEELAKELLNYDINKKLKERINSFLYNK